MRTPAHKQIGRVDRPQFDTTAVFEAVANAVAHRDYSVHSSKNRLELYSPGGLANSLTIDTLRYRQATRNEALCNLPAPDEPWLKTERRNILESAEKGPDHPGQQ